LDTYIWGGGGGALIIDRCRAFDLFANVDAHLWCKSVWFTCAVVAGDDISAHGREQRVPCEAMEWHGVQQLNRGRVSKVRLASYWLRNKILNLKLEVTDFIVFGFRFFFSVTLNWDYALVWNTVTLCYPAAQCSFRTLFVAGALTT
jgi:hypothetical protein